MDRSERSWSKTLCFITLLREIDNEVSSYLLSSKLFCMTVNNVFEYLFF